LLNCKGLMSYKLAVVGDSESGKSSLLYRLSHKKFNPQTHSTVCAEFYSKVLPSGQRVNMWDTAGQERYRTLLPMYVKNVNLIILVYDITNKTSYNSVKDFWSEWVLEKATPDPSIKCNDDITYTQSFNDTDYECILVGNKCDLTDKRAVSVAEGNNLAKKIGVPFIETSAKQGLNMEALWELIEKALVGKKMSEIKKDTVSIDPLDTAQQQQGCFGGRCVIV